MRLATAIVIVIVIAVVIVGVGLTPCHGLRLAPTAEVGRAEARFEGLIIGPRAARQRRVRRRGGERIPMPRGIIVAAEEFSSHGRGYGIATTGASDAIVDLLLSPLDVQFGGWENESAVTVVASDVVSAAIVRGWAAAAAVVVKVD